MRYWLILVLTVFGWLFAPGAALADKPDTRCTWATAQPTTIEAVQADYPAWAGKCVRLRGMAVGNHLFVDRFALLERTELYGEGARRSIVIYPERRSPNRTKAARIEVVGRIGSCAAANDAVAAMSANEPDSIIMVSGYCHTSLETYLRPSATRTLSSAEIPRLVEAEVPASDRPLVDLPSGLAGRDAHLAAARALARALALRDERAWRRISQPNLQADLDQLDGDMPVRLRERMGEAHAEFRRQLRLHKAFAAIMPLSPARERVLTDRNELVGMKPTEAVERLIACWCKAADCAGRWPVIAFDADNDPRRPYLCITTGDYLLGPRKPTVIQAEANVKKSGFGEPRWAR
jgi:hypothetical protein